MKRSEKYARTARCEAGMCLLFLSAATAAGVWAVAVMQADWLLGGTGLFALAAASLCAALCHGRECWRCLNIAERESLHEMRNSIRPRI